MSWNTERYNEILQEAISDLYSGRCSVYEYDARFEQAMDKQDFEAAKAIKEALKQYNHES